MEQSSSAKVAVKKTASEEKRWRQIQHRHKSAYGTSKASSELFFYNTLDSPLGRIVAAGTGKCGKLANRVSTEESEQLREQHYSLLMVLESSGGFYRNENGF